MGEHDLAENPEEVTNMEAEELDQEMNTDVGGETPDDKSEEPEDFDDEQDMFDEQEAEDISENQVTEMSHDDVPADVEVNATFVIDACGAYGSRHGYSWICDGHSGSSWRVRCLNGRECAGTRQYCPNGCYGAGICTSRGGDHYGRRRWGFHRRRGGDDGYYHRRRGSWGAQSEPKSQNQETHTQTPAESSKSQEVPLFLP